MPVASLTSRDVLTTKRLRLVCFDVALMRTAAASREQFARVLDEREGLRIATDWPNPEIAEALPFIAEGVAGTPGLDAWQRLMVDMATNRVVGEIGFKSLPVAGGEPEIGYGVCASCRGKGLATEALVAMARAAIKRANVKRVLAECLPSNVGSVRVLEKAGFARMREAAEMVFWALEST